MLQKLQRARAKKGFTLVELIIVIAIISVLAAILIPTMMGYVEDARQAATAATISAARNAFEAAGIMSFINSGSPGGVYMVTGNGKDGVVSVSPTIFTAGTPDEYGNIPTVASGNPDTAPTAGRDYMIQACTETFSGSWKSAAQAVIDVNENGKVKSIIYSVDGLFETGSKNTTYIDYR